MCLTCMLEAAVLSFSSVVDHTTQHMLQVFSGHVWFLLCRFEQRRRMPQCMTMCQLRHTVNHKRFQSFGGVRGMLNFSRACSHFVVWLVCFENRVYTFMFVFIGVCGVAGYSFSCVFHFFLCGGIMCLSKFKFQLSVCCSCSCCLCVHVVCRSYCVLWFDMFVCTLLLFLCLCACGTLHHDLFLWFVFLSFFHVFPSCFVMCFFFFRHFSSCFFHDLLLFFVLIFCYVTFCCELWAQIFKFRAPLVGPSSQKSEKSQKIPIKNSKQRKMKDMTTTFCVCVCFFFS